MKLSAKSPVFVFTAVWIFYVFVVFFFTLAAFENETPCTDEELCLD